VWRKIISLDLWLSLISYFPLWEIIDSSWDLSSPLSLQGAVIILSEDEDEPSSICGSPIQRWIDQACGYSFQHDFLPPTHLHEFLSMIDHMLIYAHDYYVLDLSLLYYMIKHRGRYLDEMISWLHWLYDFT
jgi:hypothetical protein